MGKRQNGRSCVCVCVCDSLIPIRMSERIFRPRPFTFFRQLIFSWSELLQLWRFLLLLLLRVLLASVPRRPFSSGWRWWGKKMSSAPLGATAAGGETTTRRRSSPWEASDGNTHVIPLLISTHTHTHTRRLIAFFVIKKCLREAGHKESRVDDFRLSWRQRHLWAASAPLKISRPVPPECTARCWPPEDCLVPVSSISHENEQSWTGSKVATRAALVTFSSTLPRHWRTLENDRTVSDPETMY